MRERSWAAAHCMAPRHTLQGPRFPVLAVHCRAFAAHCRARRHRRGFRTAPSQVRPIAVTAVWVVSRGPEAKTSRPRQIMNSSARLLQKKKKEIGDGQDK